MSANAELARRFYAIADLLDLGGERFKPEAYRRAARSLESLAEPVEAVAERGELSGIPGIGSALSEKIQEFLRTGQIAYYERLRAQFPGGLLELVHRPGIGPKTARRLLVELGVQGPTELLEAIDAGRLAGLKGFGARKIALLRAAVEQAEGVGRRLALLPAAEAAERLVDALRSAADLKEIEVAGSLRRRRESVGDLDILVTAADPAQVMQAFVDLPEVADVRMHGPTKSTVVLADGLQVDLRVVEPGAFGAAWQYFTGSKDHNVRLRAIARDRGLKINEYGVFRGDARIAGATEAEVYATVGLPWFPPEVRENQGEFEAAAAGRLPQLLAESDLRGELHVHLPDSVELGSIGRWIDQATVSGLAYLGLILPDAAAAARRWREEAAPARAMATKAGLSLLLGLERARPPPRPVHDGVDFWVLRGGPQLEPPARLGSWSPLYRAHRGGVGAHADRLDRWAAFARAHGVAVEVTAEPAVSGLDSGQLRRHVESGGRLVVSGAGADARAAFRRRLAAGLARRAAALRAPPPGRGGGRAPVAVRAQRTTAARAGERGRTGPEAPSAAHAAGAGRRAPPGERGRLRQVQPGSPGTGRADHRRARSWGGGRRGRWSFGRWGFGPLQDPRDLPADRREARTGLQPGERHRRAPWALLRWPLRPDSGTGSAHGEGSRHAAGRWAPGGRRHLRTADDGDRGIGQLHLGLDGRRRGLWGRGLGGVGTGPLDRRLRSTGGGRRRPGGADEERHQGRVDAEDGDHGRRSAREERRGYRHRGQGYGDGE